MNRILKEIYCRYEDAPTIENQLEPPELKKAVEEFFNRYFGHFPRDEYDKVWNRLLDIIQEYEKNAFETGFYAGIKLMENKQS